MLLISNDCIFSSVSKALPTRLWLSKVLHQLMQKDSSTWTKLESGVKTWFNILHVSPLSLFSQRLAAEAEKFQMEHVWRDGSEVSELISSLMPAALRTDQAVPRTP